MLRGFVVSFLALLALGPAPASAAAQELQIAGRGPRFFAADAERRLPVDANEFTVLRRRVTLALDQVPLDRALKEITSQAGLQITYSRVVVPVDRPVSLHAQGITVAAALTEILFDFQVDVSVARSGHLALVRRDGGKAGVQAGSVTGRVTDAKTGEGLVGAEVALEGARARTTTGDDGRYRLNGVAAGSYTLAVRRIGYTRQTRAVTVVDGEEVTVDVALESRPTQLNEIVTTVTGAQRRVELGHVVGRINADSLVKEAPVSSVSELLTGRVPGLQVFQSQGTVGGEVKLQVRGMNSMSLNTEPIVIIDGVRYTTLAQRSLFVGPGFVEPTSPLNDLNPNDIESIEVVKGPSAATLYGTDAANGVLVITTKRGRPGPARWNVYAKGTQTEIPTQRFPDLYWGWGTVDGVPDNTFRSCTLSRLASGACTQQDSITMLPNPLNDPALTLFGNAPRWEYGASVAGGRQDLRYYFSGDFEDATGPIQMPPAIAEQLRAQRGLDELPEEWREPNTQTKLNLRANVTAVVGEHADVRVHSGYVHSATRSLAVGQRNPYATGAFNGDPTAPYGGTFNRGANPAEAFAQTSTERTDRFFGSASAQWQPWAWLATRATVGLDLSSRHNYGLARRGDAPSDFVSVNGAVDDARTKQLATTAELGATATARHGRVSTRTAVGVQYVRSLADGLASSGRDLPPGGTSVGEAASIESRQSYGETVTLGSYLEQVFGWNERLFLTGALRVDGASAFGRNYDAAVYPKVSASWLLSEEPFLPRLPGLAELRVRYAFGASGLQPTPVMTRPGFFPGRALQNGVVTNIMTLDGLGNPALRPERVREHEFGFDAAALGNRLRLGLTWYHRRTVDQLVLVPLPPGLGFIYSNLGLTTQRGFEAELTAQVLDTRVLSWDVTLQHSLHRTQLVDLGRGFASEHPLGGWKEGYPLGGRFQRPLVGYADANGDGIIASNEVQRGDMAVYVGESTPPESQTLTTVVGLFDRRLRLSALLERRSGFVQLNELSLCARALCRASVDLGMPLAEQAQAQYASSSLGRVPEPGDFTRLREVTAALELPAGLARALQVRSATLALSARNLALWTDFSGADPESATVGGTVPVRGGAASGIPQGRSWTLRLDLGL